MLRTLPGALCALTLLLLCSCGGNGAKAPASGTQGNAGGNQSPPAREIALSLSARPEGQNWRVTLAAPLARDLYQFAGSISYDNTRYEVLAAEAGGGLGDPSQALYVSGEPEPGRLDFAYTRRMAGPGMDGNLNLYSIVVRPLSNDPADAAAVAADFQLDLSPERIKARDSRRQDLRCVLQESQR
ncbi:hypothetical protein IT575_09035 [bacterium]|nr:hypothetical protein [bacterium]